MQCMGTWKGQGGNGMGWQCSRQRRRRLLLTVEVAQQGVRGAHRPPGVDAPVAADAAAAGRRRVGRRQQYGANLRRAPDAGGRGQQQ